MVDGCLRLSNLYINECRSLPHWEELASVYAEVCIEIGYYDETKHKWTTPHMIEWFDDQLDWEGDDDLKDVNEFLSFLEQHEAKESDGAMPVRLSTM